jgi:arylamine N-acetyltransferase
MYSEGQLCRYLKHVSLPPDWPSKPLSLANLTELIRQQLATVPFESIMLHYSKYRLLSLDPNDLFEKVVGRGMGGYCMENNTLFGTVLRSFGFTIINAGGRVSDATAGKPGGGYMGW